MIELPKISIITPSYNQGQFIEETINSIINQKYPNLEYIVIDGGSDDNTVDIIRRYHNNIYYWVSEKDNGQTHAILKGMEKSSGEIITWINSDDCLAPEALFKMAQIYLKESADYYVGNAIIIDENSLEKHKINCKIFDGSFENADVFIVQPASFFTKKSYEKFGPLDAKLFYSMDMDFWLKIYFSRGKFLKFEENICLFREHSNSKTSDGYDFFISELIIKYKNSIDTKNTIISHIVDSKILRIQLSKILINGSLKKKLIYKHLLTAILTIGFKTVLFNFSTNVFNTIKRRLV